MMNHRTAGVTRAWIAVLLLWLGGTAEAAQRFGLRQIPVPGSPAALLSVADRERLFVALPDVDLVAVIDTAADRVIDLIATSGEPRLLAFDRTRDRLLVTSPGRVEAFQYDGTTWQSIAASTTAFASPQASVLHPDTGRLFISDRDLSGLGVIEFPGLEFHVEEALGDSALRKLKRLSLDPDNRQLAVPLTAGLLPGYVGALSVVDPVSLTIEAVFDAHEDVIQIDSSPVGRRLYSLVDSPAYYLGIVVYIDLDTADGFPVSVGRKPESMQVDVARDRVYVGSRESWFVARIKGSDLTALNRRAETISLPAPAAQVLLHAPARRLFAVDDERSRVNVIDTDLERVVATYDVGAGPAHAAIEESSGKLYTADREGGTVSSLVPLVDPDRSSIEVAPDGITANATSTSVITVTVRDGAGLPLGGNHAVAIAATAGTLVGTPVYVGGGQYTQELQSTVQAETAIVTAVVDGISLSDRPTVAFQRLGWPELRTAEPDWGFTSGGNEVVLTGFGFLAEELREQPRAELAAAVEVYFDSIQATVLQALTDDQLMVIAPPHAAGVVDLSVVKIVEGERRESFLRGGYTYVEGGSLQLTATKGALPGQVQLRWQDTALPLRLRQGTDKTFGTFSETPGLTGGESIELAPRSRVTYYRLER